MHKEKKDDMKNGINARLARADSPDRISLRFVESGKREFSRNGELYLMMLLPLTYLIIFRYVPIYGVQIAFKKFVASKGITRSPWVGLAHFEKFFTSYKFRELLANTLLISIYHIAVSFPVPIILALSLNYCLGRQMKKTVQMVTYAPHFISIVVLSGILLQLLSPRYGLVNKLIDLLGGKQVNFIGVPSYFPSIVVWSTAWQTTGWSSIIYLAALSNIDPQLHESAIVDGANKLQRIWHIDIAGITPVMLIVFLIKLGKIMTVDFQRVFLLQNPMNASRSEIIQTYVYKVGIASQIPMFDYAAAIGLFLTLVNFIMVASANTISRRIKGSGLW